METRRRRRARIETALATVSAALVILTLALPEWIELLTGLDPDAGSGALELAVTGTLLVVTIGFTLVARGNRRRLAAQQT